MTYTRVQMEVILGSRVGTLLAEAELLTTLEGANTDLNDSLLFALLTMGESVTDISLVADADIAAISELELLEFLDYGEYRLLMTIHANLVFVDIKVGHRQEEFSQLANRVWKAVEAKKKYLKDVYGYSEGAIEAGMIDLDLLQNNDDTRIV